MIGDEIYFTTTKGNLVTNHDIAKAAIINGDYIEAWNLEEIKMYAKNCKGIIKEINPSIKTCLQNGDKFAAIKLYFLRHPGISLKEAKDKIDALSAKM